MLSRFAAALLIALSLLAPLARADVRDAAHLFGQQVLDDANNVTDRMDRQYHKQLVVETFASVPAERRAEAEQNKPAFFKSWMASRAKALRANGVYVLICMDPKYVEVGAGAETRARGIFTADDVLKLRQRLQADLKNKQYDTALADAVRQVADTYAANIPNAKPLDAPMPVQTTAPAPEPTTRPTTQPTTQPAR